MGKLESTWKLVRQSFTVLRQEKKLLFFPLVISFFMIFIFLFFLAPIPFQPTGYSYLEMEHWEAVAESLFRGDLSQVEAGGSLALDTWFLGYLTLLYLVSMLFLTKLSPCSVSTIFRTRRSPGTGTL